MHKDTRARESCDAAAAAVEPVVCLSFNLKSYIEIKWIRALLLLLLVLLDCTRNNQRECPVVCVCESIKMHTSAQKRWQRIDPPHIHNIRLAGELRRRRV